MAQRLPYFLTIIVLAVGIPVGAVLLFNTDDIMLFEGVEGPDTPTTIQAVSPTSWTKYGIKSSWYTPEYLDRFCHPKPCGRLPAYRAMGGR